MRSQKEIKNKIGEIGKSKSDPQMIQRRILIQKLNWANAKFFLKQNIWNDPVLKRSWKKHSRLDEQYIKYQIKDLLFFAYNQYIDDDYLMYFAALQELIIYVWLLGAAYDALMREVIHRFVNLDDVMDNEILDLIIGHFGWRVKTFFQKEQKPDNIIVPKKGNIILPGE